VVLGLGGEVLGVEQGAPPAWRGAKLHERADVPAALRDAARAALAQARRGDSIARTRVDVDGLGATVELVALPGVPLQRTPVDMGEIVRHAVAALERQARGLDVGLSVSVAADVPRSIRVDPEKIAWVIAALAGSAMRYIRCGTRHLPGGSIAVTVSVVAREVLLVVEDDGPGIPADVADRLFRRAPGGAPAAGLALSVARDIVEAHGGSLDVASSTDEADHGTTVTVRLPLE